MAVCVASEGQHQLGHNAETFEDRLMLTVTGFGMAGDSLTDEYVNETHNYAQNWVELLGEYRSGDIPLGIYKDIGGGTWGGPRRNGYEYNWARSGATSATLLSAGQHTGLAGQIAANKVSHAAIAIGQNDFLPDFSGAYFDIYLGNWTQTQIDTHVNAVVGRITTALNTVATNNVKIILSNIIDYGLAPLTQTFFPDAARRQSVTDVINVVNAQLRQLASDRNIPLLDLSRLSVDLLDGSSFRIGGNVITATAGTGVQNIFVDDGVHPHTGTSSIIANAYLQALNSGYGESIPLFSEQELTTILNLTYSSDTLSFDYPSYVAAPPLITLSIDNSTLAEAGGLATVTATLSAVSMQNVTVDLGFSGTAANANDYTRSATQIVIPAGSTTGSVTLTAVQDTLDETDETIVVDITSATNGNESGSQQVAVTIGDDDLAPTVVLSLSDSSMTEAGGVATVAATLSVVSAQIVTVNLDFSGSAANGNDYTRSATQIVIPAGSTTGSIALTAVQDAIDETAETIVVDITSVTNGNESGTQQVTATIDDDDDPPTTVALSLSSSLVAEAGGVATVMATLSAVSAQNVTVDLAFSGTATNVNDYARSNTQIEIPAGSTTGSITLTAAQDTIDETAETIVVDIASVTNGIESGTQQVTTTIDDDDPTPTVALSLSGSPLTEAGGVATVMATLSAVSAQIVTVNLDFSGSAANGNDYTRSATQIVIPAGSTTGSIALTAVQDAIDETAETIVVDITSVTNGNESGTQQVTATIDDDDDFDFGDAPDTSAGTSTFNYNTLATDNGPSHTIVAGLFLGDTVDGDNGTLQNVSANADDVNGSLPDDEDGVLSPLDLLGTVGAASTVALLVTNTTGATATLAGWIDYNRNGVFDNATERAQIAVPDGSNDDRFTLTFPTIPDGSAGKTYARFRLSTDAAFVANPGSTGVASDGEVEDYTFSVTPPFPVTVDHFLKIASDTSGGPTLGDRDFFGKSVASLGDLDGDGVADLAVGAYGNDTGGSSRGAVYMLLMNASGTVKSRVKIASDTSGGPTLADGDGFGRSVASLGDLDGDGVADLAVGARGDDTGGGGRGAVHVLMLNADGTVKSFTKIASGTSGGPTLADGDFFGSSVTSLGDLDGDGVADLAVGAPRDDTGGNGRGAVHVLLLNADGTVKSFTKIAHNVGGGPTIADNDRFGSSVTSVGDLDGDGVADLAVGAFADDTGGNARGAVHVLLLNADGTVKSRVKIASDVNGGPTLVNADQFGRSVTSVGDLDGDGVAELAVGAIGDDTTGNGSRGAVHVLLLNADGTAKSSTKIAHNAGGGPTIAYNDNFGSSVASMGDLDGDGVPDLAVGAFGDDTGGTYRGAVHVLFLQRPQPEAISLPAGGGSYEVLRDGEELVIRVQGGADLFRHLSNMVTELTLTGSSDADIVTVLDSGGVVSTPISFSGEGGNDRFDGSLGSGDHTINGGAGDDTVLAGAGNDVVSGDAGINELAGGVGTDTLVVRGNSRLSINASTATGSGNDSFSEFEQAILEAGPGNNRLDASAASIPVTLLGSDGNDTLLGGSQNDSLDGGAGIDFVELTGTNLVLTNGSAPGNDGDTLQSVERLLLIAAGPGSVIDASAFTLGSVTIVGSSGNDTLKGGTGNDLILAGSGRDVVTGGSGDDRIAGEGGGDSLSGGSGNDTIIGGRGRDTIEGDLDADELRGGGGPDTIRGGDGNDHIRGGGGRDILDGDDGTDTLFGGGGRDNLAGGLGDDTLNGVSRDDNFNDQIGRDTLIGGIRPAARPAPVVIKDDPAIEEETPLFQSPPGYSERIEEIDEAFAERLLPELLEL